MAAKSRTLVDQLRDAIRRSGLTHYRLAKDAHVTPNVIGRFVSGERDLHLKTASKLARALGLELHRTSKRTNR